MGFVKVSQLKKIKGEINSDSLIYIVQDGKSYSIEFSVIKAFFKDSLSLGAVNPTTETTDLPDGVYVAQISGSYPNAGNIVVKEGYYTLLRKKDGVWSLESEVKMPSVDINGNIVVGQTTKAVNGDRIAQYIGNTSFSNFIQALSVVGYDLDAVVYYNEKLYKSLEPDNKSLPTDTTKWKEIKLATEVDQEFNINSENAIANKTVTEFVNKKDINSGWLSYEVGIGAKSTPSVNYIWEALNLNLETAYYTRNNNTGVIEKVTSHPDFKTATFTAEAGERIRVKIGQFYIQNNSNGINPICIHIKNQTGEVTYYSDARKETGLPFGSSTGVFEFERDINEDSTIMISGDYKSAPILQASVRHTELTVDVKILNTGDIDKNNGVLSYEAGIGSKTISVKNFEKISPELTSEYYTYNVNTGETALTPFSSFRLAVIQILAGESVRAKMGSFYVSNTSPTYPLLIHARNTDGELIYYSNGLIESGIQNPPVGYGVSTPIDYTWTFNEDCTVYISCDFQTGGGVFNLWKREAGGKDVSIVNTGMADVPGGYKSYDGVETSKYKGKRIAILGDSLSEDPPAGQAPTTSKYWYSFMKEQLDVIYKTYAVSGNTWKDVYNQAVAAKASGVIYDMFIIFAGTNDFYFSVSIGEFYTTNGNVRTLNLSDTTFKGRINKVLNYLKRNFPNAQIVVLNILHRGAAHGTPDELTANSSGIFLDEYSKAIDEGAPRWGVPVIDVRGESGLYPVVPEALAYYTSANDYLHLSALGHEKLWKYMQNKLMSLPI